MNYRYNNSTPFIKHTKFLVGTVVKMCDALSNPTGDHTWTIHVTWSLAATTDHFCSNQCLIDCRWLCEKSLGLITIQSTVVPSVVKEYK